MGPEYYLGASYSPHHGICFAIREKQKVGAELFSIFSDYLHHDGGRVEADAAEIPFCQHTHSSYNGYPVL
jgi:hypothetical protein